MSVKNCFGLWQTQIDDAMDSISNWRWYVLLCTVFNVDGTGLSQGFLDKSTIARWNRPNNWENIQNVLHRCMSTVVVLLDVTNWANSSVFFWCVYWIENFITCSTKWLSIFAIRFRMIRNRRLIRNEELQCRNIVVLDDYYVQSC